MIEAMKQALEALETADWYINLLEMIVYSADDNDTHEERIKIQQAITSLRQAISELEQRSIAELESQEPVKWADYEPNGMQHNKPSQRTEQESVAWIVDYEGDKQLSWYHPKNSPSAPLYTHPPQEQQSCDKRTWVGLTDEEICMFSMWLDDKPDAIVFSAIEAKLKQKNGYAEEKRT